LAIGLVGISAPWEKVADGQDTIFFKLGDIKNLLTDIKEFGFSVVAPLLGGISANLTALTQSSLAFLIANGSDKSQAAAVALANSLITSAAQSSAEVVGKLQTIYERLGLVGQNITQGIATQTRQLQDSLVILADQIYKSLNPLGTLGTVLGAIGGGLGSLGNLIGSAGNTAAGAAGQGFGDILGAIVGAFGSREEGTLNAIEQHTKVMSIVLSGISAPWEKAGDTQEPIFFKLGDVRNLLQDIRDFNWNVLHPDLVNIWQAVHWPNFATQSLLPSINAIRDYITSTKQPEQITTTQSAPVINNYFTINEATDARETAIEVANYLKLVSPVFT